MYLAPTTIGALSLGCRADELYEPAPPDLKPAPASLDLAAASTTLSWSLGKQLPVAVRAATATATGGRIFLFGGNLGSASSGITIVQVPELVQSNFVSEPFTNAVVAVQNGFWSGMETGDVAYFDSQDQLVQKLNLPTITGHTGPEEIEIRSLWADGYDDLVFAASTWGNDASRGPTLPSFFVLRLR